MMPEEPRQVEPVRRRRGPAPYPDEYVPMNPPGSGGRRVLALLAVVVGLVVLAVAGGVLWASRQVTPSGEQGARIEVEVPPGSSTDGIATLLADKGVISSPSIFNWWARWQGVGPWKAGRYTEFRANSSYSQAVEVLDAGPVPPTARVVRIPEGKKVSEALAIIEKSMPGLTQAELLTALGSGKVTSKYKPANVSNWEGFLFPDTYQFNEDASAVEVLQTMATKMDDVLDELGYDKAEALRGRTPYELVTIASLIERETGQPADERGKIARVILNRLDAGETLGIDASNLYGLGRTSGELTKADLEVQSPYNLRINKGLPPTPIALPGRASLAAAIDPATGPWKYYVLTSKDPPSHFFTDSYKEFQRAAADARARGVF